MKTATKISTNDQAAMLAVMRNAVDHLKQLKGYSDANARRSGTGAIVFSAFATENVIDALVDLLQRNDPEHWTNDSSLYQATR
jgi:4-diphosphocytidyl-2C-methyl-D-erythritol kinase